MSDKATRLVSNYINKRGIKISAVSRGTGIPDGILRRCLSSQERDFRADEFLSVCMFLEVDPMLFQNISHDQ
jgi:hypothetical protein